MKVLLHPGGALFVMALLAFALRLFAPAIPAIGGLIATIALFAMIFGFVGGIFLTLVVRRGEARA